MTKEEKIEAILEYQYLSSNYQHCAQQFAANVQRLKQSPGNVVVMAEQERIKHDSQLLVDAMSETQKSLLYHYEQISGIEFKYLVKREPPQMKINGSK